MIYIVSGYMRTGTSAMMAALIAGGMRASWDDKRDKQIEKLANEFYHPNKRGVFEIDLGEYKDFDFPLKYQDKLIKVMAWGLDFVSVGEYSVILMRRNKEEIAQSYERWFGVPLKAPWFVHYYERMNRAENMLKNRKDVVSLSCLEYSKVVSNPLSAFQTLNEIGWPIDPIKASAEIDPKQYRFRSST